MRIKVFIIFAICLFLIGLQSLYSQTKQISALKIDSDIKIDGVLDEKYWLLAEPADDFIVFHPNNADKPDQKTEVRILYNNHSIYIGAKLKDSEPDKILTELSPRDRDNANVDYFGVSINPNNDGQNVYEFIVSAANVQTDIRISGDTRDYNWDAVWYSEVNITDSGWIVEIQIPYSSIRFPQGGGGKWGANFWRIVRRTRQESSWNYVDPNRGNKISQMGEITNITGIEAPLRLSLMPYISGYANHSAETNNIGYSLSGGLDLKMGLSEAYTLDVTLIPDFGQVRTDEEILNLTPHETYYNENRPFFTEGTELFNKCGIFYSRRIGKIPNKYYEIINKENKDYEIVNNPRYSRLINALKLSGRNKNNFAVGVFNAVTANTYAYVNTPEGKEEQILTEPAANYNMIVLDQSIGRYSYLNLTNANVFRDNNRYMSNVTAGAYQIMNKTNRFGVRGITALSMQNNINGRIADGWYTEASAGKMNGKWIYYYNAEIISEDYNPNDMGYLTKFNQISHGLNLAWRQFTPFSVFNDMTHRLSVKYNSLYSERAYTSTELELHSYTTTQNYTSFWNTFKYSPFGENDYYEPRTPGRFYKRAAMMHNSFFISTDYRKRLALDLRLGLYKDSELRHGLYSSISPLTRFGQRLTLRYTFFFDYDLKEAGYVEKINSDDIIFGRRDVLSFSNSLNLDYIFTNKLSLGVIHRHYASTVDYHHFYKLQDTGELEKYENYNKNKNFNYNIFTLDFLVSWNFAPGSFMTVMWKSSIFESGIIPEYATIPNYYQNFKNLWNNPGYNSFSIRLIYYLDYQSIVS